MLSQNSVPVGAPDGRSCFCRAASPEKTATDQADSFTEKPSSVAACPLGALILRLLYAYRYSTVTLFARFLGISGSSPRSAATSSAKSSNATAAGSGISIS